MRKNKVEVLREQKFSQGQNHNYRKGKLDYRRRFNTQLIITLFLMWWLLKEPFDLIRSCCPPYFLAAFFGDFFATFSAGFLGAVGFFLAEEFASDMLIILEPSELTHEMIPWSAQGNVIPRERTTEETGLLQNGGVQTVLVCLTFRFITSQFDNFRTFLIIKSLPTLSQKM